jgi:hypothetical protein
MSKSLRPALGTFNRTGGVITTPPAYLSKEVFEFAAFVSDLETDGRLES